MAGGGGGCACVWACTATFVFLGCAVPGVCALCSIRGFLLCASPPPFFLLVSFFLLWEGGLCSWGTVFAVLGVGVGACRCWCSCGRHGAVGRLRPLRSGFPVSVSALGHPVAFGFRGSGQGGAGVERSVAVAVWRLCGWSWLLGSARVASPDAGVRGVVFLVQAVWG